MQLKSFKPHRITYDRANILLFRIMILTEALAEKLDIFARTCYQIILGIKQSRDQITTNERLYQRVNQEPIQEMIRERQLNFKSHCMCMPTDELVNRFIKHE